MSMHILRGPVAKHPLDLSMIAMRTLSKMYSGAGWIRNMFHKFIETRSQTSDSVTCELSLPHTAPSGSRRQGDEQLSLHGVDSQQQFQDQAIERQDRDSNSRHVATSFQRHESVPDPHSIPRLPQRQQYGLPNIIHVTSEVPNPLHIHRVLDMPKSHSGDIADVRSNPRNTPHCSDPEYVTPSEFSADVFEHPPSHASRQSVHSQQSWHLDYDTGLHNVSLNPPLRSDADWASGSAIPALWSYWQNMFSVQPAYLGDEFFGGPQ